MDRFDIYYAGLVAMTLHPGFNRPDTITPTIRECANIALAMIEEREKCLGQQQEQQ